MAETESRGSGNTAIVAIVLLVLLGLLAFFLFRPSGEAVDPGSDINVEISPPAEGGGGGGEGGGDVGE